MFPADLWGSSFIIDVALMSAIGAQLLIQPVTGLNFCAEHLYDICVIQNVCILIFWLMVV